MHNRLPQKHETSESDQEGYFNQKYQQLVLRISRMDTLDPPPSYPKQNFIIMGPASGPASAAAVPYPGQGPAPVPALVPVAQQVSPHEKFLKGQPKALGTVQIMIGATTLMLVLNFILTSSPLYPASFTIFAPAFYITAGALTIAGANFKTPCLIKGSLVMNVISAVAAGTSLILLSTDVAGGRIIPDVPHDPRIFNYHVYYVFTMGEQSRGVSGVLLVLCMLQLIVSIWISAFSCKSPCCPQPSGEYYMTSAVVQYMPGDQTFHQQAVPV